MRCRRQVFTIKFQINALSEHSKKIPQKPNLQNPNFHYKNLRKFGLVLAYLGYLEKQEKSRRRLGKNRLKPNSGIKRPSRGNRCAKKKQFFLECSREKERALKNCCVMSSFYKENFRKKFRVKISNPNFGKEKILGLAPRKNFHEKISRKNFQQLFLPLPAAKICNIQKFVV